MENNILDLNVHGQTGGFEITQSSDIKNNLFSNEELVDLIKRYPNDIDLGKNFRMEYLKRNNNNG
jgi:hypothetical protein